MSTKIYDAYRLNDGKLKTFFFIKRRLETLYEHHVLRTVDAIPDSLYVRDIDLGNVTEYVKSLFDKKIKELDAVDMKLIIDAVIDTNSQYDRLNFRSSMVLFHCRENIYIQFFGIDFDSGKNFISSLEASNILSDFHYQNQTDIPDNTTEEEYEKRRVIWDEIYKAANSYTPGEVGLSYDFWNRGLSILGKRYKK
jgi:hypothetical protein